MKIAVLMSTYNGERYLEEQINSILEQRGDFQFDLWVRDDQSTDTTKTILERYQSQGKLSWYSGPNIGAGSSFIDLIQHCSGYDYYAFSDQDDWWMPDKIATGIAMLAENTSTVSLYCCNAKLVDSNRDSLGRNLFNKPPRTDFMTFCCAGGLPGCMMIFNRKLAKMIQDKPPNTKIMFHDAYIATVCLAVGGTITYDSTPYMEYRRHGNNVTEIPAGRLQAIRNRYMCIIKNHPWSIAEQASIILALYIDKMNKQQRQWLKTVTEYRSSLITRVKLGCSCKIHFVNINQAITIRSSIILGKR